ncbi:MAG: hypothetical protein JXX14_15080 [Deltaproteobacteria bacterium]|nr:hypothetical protein [Deltaproteobacteria bacterium]
MGGNYYDVVVVGASPGPLCAGALLAKRGFRVLITGQNGYRNRYECAGYEFVKRPFLINGASSPAVSRIIEELSLGQLFSHAEIQSLIKYQVVLPKHRVSVFGDRQKTLAELEREFSKYTGSLHSILANIESYSTDFKKLVHNDLVIPADNFFERRDFSRAVVQHPFLNHPRLDLWERLGISGALRECLSAPMQHQTALAPLLPPLVAARGLAAWFTDTRYIRNGLDGFRRLVSERIVEYGGDVQPDYVAGHIGVSRGRVERVQLRGRTESVATRVVLTDLYPSQLAQLVDPGEWTGQFRAQVEDQGAFAYGYALNLGVLTEVIPVGMADTVFVAPGYPGGSALRIEVSRQPDASRTALNISCAVPAALVNRIDSGALRDTILDKARELIPYLDQYLEVIHSPFDGFGAIDLTGSRTPGASDALHPDQVPRWIIQPPVCFSGIGIENIPHRTGIKGLLMAGEQVNTALGVESELISAWGAAKIVARMDPTRQRLVRAMRAKIEM